MTAFKSSAEVCDGIYGYGMGEREAFASRIGWYHSTGKENPTIRLHNWRVTIFPKGEGFGAVLKRWGVLKPVFAQLTYTSEWEAKLAAFDAMKRIDAKLAQSHAHRGGL